MTAILLTLFSCMWLSRSIYGLESKIVDGKAVQVEKFPHSVLLDITTYQNDHQENKDGWICGASIINQKTLLTACHCVEHFMDTTHIFAFIGSKNLSEINVMEKVKKIARHMDYNSRFILNDIAIALLRQPLTFSSQIKRVWISKEFPPNPGPLYVTGWGNVDDVTDESSTVMKLATQNLEDTKECKLAHVHDSRRFCAKYASNDQSAGRPSTGDSGGALITKNHQQLGLVSFRPNYRSHQLVVYTNVTYYYNWIKEITQILICME